MIFKSELEAGTWLARVGFIYGGHLHNEGTRDHLQTTAWLRANDRPHRAELAPAADGCQGWEVRLISDSVTTPNDGAGLRHRHK